MAHRYSTNIIPGPFDQWLAERGQAVADALELRRDAICAATALQLIKTFPGLCYEPDRFDAVGFQRHAIQQTPHRFHKLLRVVLIFHTFSPITQEYEWACGVLPRHGVNRTHLLATAGWYFNAARTLATFTARDKAFFNGLKRRFLEEISDATIGLPTERELRRAEA